MKNIMNFILGLCFGMLAFASRGLRSAKTFAAICLGGILTAPAMFAQVTEDDIMTEVNDALAGLKTFAIGIALAAIGIAVVYALLRHGKKGTAKV